MSIVFGTVDHSRMPPNENIGGARGEAQLGLIC